MRIGEHLLKVGLLTLEEVQQTLRAQMLWGGRFGTNAVELGFIDLDPLSREIASQYQLPAAFAKHFEAADPEVQQRLPAELAGEYACIPLCYIGTDRVVLASIAPLPGKGRALVAHELGISHRGIIPAITAELRIYYHLERAYGIPRHVRFLRSRIRSTIPSLDIDLAAEESDPDAPIPDPADEFPEEKSAPYDPLEAIPQELPDFAPVAKVEVVVDPERRHYVPTLDDEAPAIGRIGLRRKATAPVVPTTLADSTRTIRRAADREAVAYSVVETVARFLPARAAVLLLVRGGEAIGWAGFRQDGAALPELAVPLDRASLVTTVLRDKAFTRVAACELGEIDVLLLRTLGESACDLVAAPIAIGDHVWCVIAFATDAAVAVEDLDAINAAASSAFARLLRMANR